MLSISLQEAIVFAKVGFCKCSCFFIKIQDVESLLEVHVARET